MKISWKKAVLPILLLYSALHLGYSVWRYNPAVNQAGFSSMNELYTWALELKETKHLPPESGFGMFPPVYHPPLCYLIFGFFTQFDFKTVAYFFYLIQFILFPLGVCALVRAASPHGRPSFLDYAVAAIVTINFQPFLDTFAQYKIEGLEFVLISLAVLAFRKNKDFLCGALLLLASNLKYLPAILLVYFLLKRETRVLLGALGAMGGVALLLVVFLGAEPVWRFGVLHLSDLLFSPHPSSNMMLAEYEWQSLSGAINRLFAWATASLSVMDYIRIGRCMALSHPSVAYGLAILLKVPLCAVYLFFIRRSWKSLDRERVWNFHLLEMSLTLVMLVILVQAVRPNYAVLLLPAFVVIGLLLFRFRQRFHLTEKLLFLFAYSLGGTIIPGGLLNLLPSVALWGREHARAYVWWSLPFYGYILLGLCIILCYNRLTAVQGENEKANG